MHLHTEVPAPSHRGALHPPLGCPSWRVRARGSSPVRVVARGTSLGAWLRLISLADVQAACEGASGLCFRRGLVLKFRFNETNNLVQSKINFEHFPGHPNFDLGSESPPPRL